MSYLSIADDAPAPAGPFDVESSLRRQEEMLARIEKIAEKELFLRKVATGAAIIGGLMALTKLGDIWRAVQSRRQTGA
jgi:hypothetical protein